ncbi:MAG TPA: PH domain-containing protein [Candidatus Paceibacterota bacterium]
MINLEEEEKILLEQRRHWFVIGTTGAIMFGVILAPIIFVIVILGAFPEITAFFEDIKFIWIAVFFILSWTLIMWVSFFIAWTDYYLDVLIVTNKRVVDVEQRGLFRRDLATVPLQNIQDIKIEINGLIPTLLRFGNLHIQTAGVSKEVLIKDIKEPTEVKKIILSAYHDTLGKQL